MNDLKLELINFRLNRADEALEVALLAASKKYWNSAASALYYTCYYLIIALFVKNNIKTSTHSGVRTVFGSHFIQKGIIDQRWAKLLSKLFRMRQDSDYGDFIVFKENEIRPFIDQVEEFRILIKDLIAEGPKK